ESIDVLVGQVETAERVVGCRIVLAPVVDQRSDPSLHERDPGEQVRQSGRAVGAHDGRSSTGMRPSRDSAGGQPSWPATVIRGGWTTGAPVSGRWPVSVGAVTTTSSEGFSSRPSADHTSANARSSGGGNPIVIGTGRPTSASGAA